MKKLYILLVFSLIPFSLLAQTEIQGKVLDKETKEPISGVNITTPDKKTGTTTNNKGSFVLKSETLIDSLVFSSVGHIEKRIAVLPGKIFHIELEPDILNFQEIIITAGREEQDRADAPLAIHKISPKLLDETKPTLLYEVMNKVPGVVMVNLNNEQHGMSIRQPLGLSPYFLYMEDGIPLRPTGVFNHNALIEMNMLAINSIEVVKGPVSSLYGGEAIGGAINFITNKPTSIPTARLGFQLDNYGYFRTQFGAGGFITKNLGIYAGGFIAQQRNGWHTFSDYDKVSINARADYYINETTKIVAAFTHNNYDSQMGGSVDSASYYERQYKSLTDFAYRKVKASRTRITLEKSWAKNNHAFITFFYRKNSVGQFPAYAIKRVASSPAIAHGEINDNSFHSYGTIIQNTAHFNFLKSKLTTGISVDYSPNSYWAYYVRITRDPVTGLYTDYEEKQDSLLVDYYANLLNSAAYAQYEISPWKQLKVVIGIRYDRTDFRFDNHLPPSAFSGAPDETNGFNNLTPKIGATYNFENGTGTYVNYSRGFSPPTISQLYRGVKVPELKPAYFDNFEVGGWMYLFKKKVYADVSLYQMNGYNEVVNFLLPDGSRENRNSGQTLHRGIEYSMTLSAMKKQLFFRFGGTNAIHKFVEYSTKEGQNLDGKEMPNSPAWIANTEITYKPAFLPNVRMSLEWQRVSSYYKDNDNKFKYEDKTAFDLKGVSILNFRTGYSFKGIEIFINVLNITDELYSSIVSRGNFGDIYTPASPRLYSAGIMYTFAQKKSEH